MKLINTLVNTVLLSGLALGGMSVVADNAPLVSPSMPAPTPSPVQLTPSPSSTFIPLKPLDPAHAHAIVNHSSTIEHHFATFKKSKHSHSNKQTAPVINTTTKPLTNDVSDTALTPVPAWLQQIRGVLTVSLGPAWVKMGDAAQLTMPDGSTVNYNPRHLYQIQTLYGFFVGSQMPINTKWELQAGLSYFQPNSFTVEGYATQSNLANQYTYYYSVVARRLLLEGKLSTQAFTILHPFATFGLGSSFNMVHHMQSFAPAGTTPSVFANEKNRTFAFAWGAGVDVDVMEQVRVGISYRFDDFGHANLGHGTQNGTRFSGTLTQANLYMNSILAQVTILGI